MATVVQNGSPFSSSSAKQVFPTLNCSEREREREISIYKSTNVQKHRQDTFLVSQFLNTQITGKEDRFIHSVAQKRLLKKKWRSTAAIT